VTLFPVSLEVQKMYLCCILIPCAWSWSIHTYYYRYTAQSEKFSVGSLRCGKISISLEISLTPNALEGTIKDYMWMGQLANFPKRSLLLKTCFQTACKTDIKWLRVYIRISEYPYVRINTRYSISLSHVLKLVSVIIYH